MRGSVYILIYRGVPRLISDGKITCLHLIDIFIIPGVGQCEESTPVNSPLGATQKRILDPTGHYILATLPVTPQAKQSADIGSLRRGNRLEVN